MVLNIFYETSRRSSTFRNTYGDIEQLVQCDRSTKPGSEGNRLLNQNPLFIWLETAYGL